jgi:chemotaxis protein MotB
MAAKEKEAGQTIIIKRIKKAAHAHHGGSWKVAFADFATAMMAFFLLLWLLGATTEKQKGAISEYFNNPSAIQGASQVPAPSSIQGPGGSSTSMIKLGGGMELHREAAPPADAAVPSPGAQVDVTPEAAAAADAAAKAADQERLGALMAELKTAIDERESLAKFKDQILLDETPEGIRIQIIDHERRSMFPSGSAVLEGFSSDILKELANIVIKVPNHLSISGHTDVRPYVKFNYSNWELSADRANAARRALISGGLPVDKIGRVVGLASSVLLDPAVPDSSINRRISIVVMNKQTEDAMYHENGSLLSVQHVDDKPAEAAAEVPATEVATVAVATTAAVESSKR